MPNRSTYSISKYLWLFKDEIKTYFQFMSIMFSQIATKLLRPKLNNKQTEKQNTLPSWDLTTY